MIKEIEIRMNDFSMKKFVHLQGQSFELDPVCGMKVDPQAPPFQVKFRGNKYYFCSKACKHIFERMPEKYLGSDQEAQS